MGNMNEFTVGRTEEKEVAAIERDEGKKSPKILMNF